MKTYILAALVVLPLVLVQTGCGKTVARKDVNTDIDLSGKWNDADSRRVSETLVKSIVDNPWHNTFRGKHDRNPVVRVGGVRVRTDGDLVATDIFTNDLRKAMINSQLVDVVSSRDESAETRLEITEQQQHASADTRKEAKQETGADYILSGTITVQNDTEGRKQVRFYQTDLHLTDVQSRKQVWFDNVKIKKYITY